MNSKQELKELNINITSNHLMGILLHIETKYAVKQELSQHIKHHVFQDPLHSAWTFENILKILTVCQHQFQKTLNHNYSLVSAIP